VLVEKSVDEKKIGNLNAIAANLHRTTREIFSHQLSLPALFFKKKNE
jgi:hypothetical protein